MAMSHGKVGAGMHSFDLNVSGLSEGVYFYTVTAGKDRVTKKMIVQ